MSEDRVCLNADCTIYAGEHHYPSQTIPRFSPQYQPQCFCTPAADGGEVVHQAAWRDESQMLFDDDTSPSIQDLGFIIAETPSSIVTTKDKLAVGLRTCELRYWMGVTDFVLFSIFNSIPPILLQTFDLQRTLPILQIVKLSSKTLDSQALESGCISPRLFGSAC